MKIRILLAALVIKDGERAYLNAVGLRMKGAPVEVTAEDAYHTGSITTSMTAVLAAIAVQKGWVSWDDTISDVLSGVVVIGNDVYNQVTLTQLLSHTGGVPNEVEGTTGNGVRLFQFRVRGGRPDAGNDLRKQLGGDDLAVPVLAPGHDRCRSGASRVTGNTRQSLGALPRSLGPWCSRFGQPGGVQLRRSGARHPGRPGSLPAPAAARRCISFGVTASFSGFVGDAHHSRVRLSAGGILHLLRGEPHTVSKGFEKLDEFPAC